MQPAPVHASDPGGQTAAELLADIGHRRPGKTAGLLEAEVVELQPVTSPSCQQPMTAWATCSGSTPSLAQVSVGQAQLTGGVGHEHQLTGLMLAGERVDQAAGRLGIRGCSSVAEATIRMVPASGSPAGPGGSSRPR